jgi:hypothetical protein
MTITLSTLNEFDWQENEIVVMMFTLVGNWTLQEFYTAFENGQAIINDMDNDVYLILNFHAQSNPPTKFLSTSSYLRKHGTGKVNKVIFINAGRLMRAVTEIVGKAIPEVAQKIRFVSSMNDALAHIMNCVQNDTQDAQPVCFPVNGNKHWPPGASF